MALVPLIIDGKRVEIENGKTVLEAAQQNGIDIPTLCHDPRLKPTAACRLCLVEIEKSRSLMPACSTTATSGMVVKTTSPELFDTRRMALELLLSDHYGDCVSPCKVACPAGIDIQGFIAHIANGKNLEALKLIKKSNPLPLVCGRVCPRFCEEKCRRNLLEGPVAINALKRFVADYDIYAPVPYQPEVKPDTGHRVAIIGGGPAGLTAAYYLAIEGHEVTIFDGNPELGGMLRYGIPEYRLPKAMLDREINSIIKLCQNVHHNVSLGKHFTIEELKNTGFEAIFVAIGAQTDRMMKIEGEDLPGVFSGIGFLRDVTTGEKPVLGRKVAVVGGGNTAVDAARTAVRLGAQEVTIIYRRSRDEMPASDEEVKGAEDEGVRFQFLAAPVRIDGRDGRVAAVHCIRMALGAPDSSGRRKPEAIIGSEYNLDADNVIIAIGQAIDTTSLDYSEIQLDGEGNINVNEIMTTSTQGVFAGGDCTSGPATAVEAIAAGHKAALVIDKYLKGETITLPDKPFNSTKGELKDIDKKDYSNVEEVARTEMPKLSPGERKTNFNEIELGLTQEIAKAEAMRCLSCGCQDVFDCKLRELATEYKVDEGNYAGHKRHFTVNVNEHPYIIRDQNKCILCGRCVRICSEVVGISALGFANRGIATSIVPSLDLPLYETNCNSCGQCVSTCPTGALMAKVPLPKPGPWELQAAKTICPHCSNGCNLEVNTVGVDIVKISSPLDGTANQGNICSMGFVNHSSARKSTRLTTPLIKSNGRLLPASWEAALTLAGAGLRQIKEQEGPGSLSVLVSPQYTNEESYLLQKLARLALGTNSVTCLSAPPINSSFRNGLGKDASTCTYGDLLTSDLIIVYDCELSDKYPVTEIKVREAVGRGSKLIVFNQRQTGLETLATLNFRINQRTGVELLQAILGYILSYQIFDAKFIDRYTSGFSDFAEAYKDRPLEKLINIPWISPIKLIEATQLYLRARKPVVILDADSLTLPESALISDLILVTGNIGHDNGGIILQRSGGNTQGLLNMGISPNYLPGQEPLESAEVRHKFEEKWHAVIPTNKGKDGVDLIRSIESGEIRGLLVAGRESFGDTGNALLEIPIFSVSIDTIVPVKPPFADVVFPGADFIETDGTYTNSENRILQIRKVLLPPAGKQNWEIISILSKRLGYSMPYNSFSEISNEISEIIKDNRPFFDLLSTFNWTNGHSRYQFILPSIEATQLNVNLGI